MTDLEEANALRQLVECYGSQTKAAKSLGMPQATISSKLSLLKLSPELQRDVVTGVRVEHIRYLGKLSPADQKKADERAAAERRNARPQTPNPSVPVGSSDSTGEQRGELSRRDNSVWRRRGRSTRICGKKASSPYPNRGPTPPKRRTGNDQPAGQQVRRFPYEDDMTAAHYLIHKMPPDEFNKMLDLLNRHRDRQTTGAG